MYKRRDFQQLMPENYDIMVHIYNIETTPKKAVHISIKGTEKESNKDFELHATEVFEPHEIADTVKRLLNSANILKAEYTDVVIWQ